MDVKRSVRPAGTTQLDDKRDIKQASDEISTGSNGGNRVRKPVESETTKCGDFVALLATTISLFLVVITMPFSLFVCFKIVQEYERAVIFRMGKLRAGHARGPGVFFVLPCTDNYTCLDLRTVTFDIPPQQVLTKDSCSVSVDGVVFYRVVSPLNAVISVENYRKSTRLLAATALRNILGTKLLSEVLLERTKIAAQLRTSLETATTQWGVLVERVEITDVRLPELLQKAMAQEAEATREARAKVIVAEGELNASKSLKQASEVLAQSPAALQLRYLQTLTAISSEKNSTIVFPFPIEMMQAFRR